MTRKPLYLTTTALSLSLAAIVAQAGPLPSLPVGASLDFTPSGSTQPKASFSSVAPIGWVGGGDLIYVDAPKSGEDAAGPVYLTTYADPVGTVPGNYVEADGNPLYEDSFSTQLSGLTIGQAYTLSFYQGASQQTTFNGTTTNQWIVALGTSSSGVYAWDTDGGNSSTPKDNCGKTCAYADADSTASIIASPLMTIPTGTAVGWDYVSVTLTADATNDWLSFLAWGDSGNTTNLPPIAFLAGVNAPSGLGAPVPEPASMTLFGVGLVGFGAIARRRRKKHSVSA